MKTIKEIADELGVPKHKVEYQVRKLPDSLRIKVQNYVLVNDDGVAKIKALLVQNLPQNFSADSLRFAELLTELLQEQKKTNELLSKLVQSQKTLMLPSGHDEDPATPIGGVFGFFVRLFGGTK
jgi:predicted transcriptional regulator